MSESMPYADIIFLAFVAGFVLLRLRSVLGKHNDDHATRIKQLPLDDNERIIQLPERTGVKTQQAIQEEEKAELSVLGNPDVATGVMAIKAVDAGFTGREFLEGARMAFEMVFTAFSKGDKGTLRNLLADDIYSNFASEIDNRATSETISETTLVSIKKDEITEAELKGNIAQVTVRFISEQIQVTRNKSTREIVSGDASLIQQIEDIWTFERDTRSRNPNWKIIAT